MASVRLESLKLTGFKSFPDEVELTFPGAVSAILGPNGCGKSNIVDAMLWVLGEQSPSLLRLKNMGDVVFSGSAKRKPATAAEIVLILRSPDGRWADRDDTLEIRRRVLRSGPSEYRMNGRVARLKDVADELLAVGLGTRHYAIIEQGRVGQVLSARPTDRRVLIEEAAGITRYKARKREAELKLEHTRQNLLRLEDVIGEVTRSLRQLKRQARQAEQYEEMRLELDRLLRQVHIIEAHAIAGRRAEAMRNRAQGQNEVAAAAAALGGAEADLIALRKELDGDRRAVEEVRAEVGRLETSRERTEAFLERSADLVDTLRESLDRNTRETAATNENRRANEVLVAEANAHLEACRAHLEDIRLQLGEAEAEQATARATLEEKEANASRFREDMLRTISALTTSRNRLGDLEREQDRVAYAASQLEQEGERIDIRRQEVGASHSEAVEASRTALQGLSLLEQRRSVLVDRRARLRETSQESKLQAESLSHQAWELRHRLAGVERELASHAAAGDRLGAVVSDEAVIGQVSDFLHPEDGAAAILDRVWAEWLELPVVHSEAIESERLKGLARLEERIRLVLAESAPAAEPWPQLEGAEPLLEAAGIVPDDRPWLLRALPPAYRCPDRETARAHSLSHPALVLVDDEGVVWRGNVVEPPSVAVRRKGGLALRAEREELVNGIRDASDRAEDSTVRHRELADELEGVEDELAGIDREVVQAEENRARTSAVEESLAGELARLENESAALARERERIEKSRTELAGKKLRLQAEVQALEVRSSDLEEGLEAATGDLDGAREIAAVALRNLDRWRAEGRLAGERDAAARREHDRVVTEDKMLEGRQLTLSTQRQEYEQSLATTEDEIVQSRSRLVEEQGLLASFRDRERRLAETVDRHSQRVARFEDEVRKRRDHHDAERERLHAVDLEVQAIAGEWERLRDACLADLGMMPEALVDSEVPGETPAEELRGGIDRLREKLERLGPVNLLALKEVEELGERSAFLKEQRKDLVESLESLDQTITEIDATCSERFLETFEKVNTVFEETFAHLFGGGTARMELVDEDDPLESGLDIVAQPPGKKNQSVQLLSGGEKALTALALLIALFRIKPSPFCILDEVDAPLDDANVERLAELVQTMTEHTQFVMVTHNRRTMQRADVLYGVTMEEPGVSKVVSVRLES